MLQRLAGGSQGVAEFFHFGSEGQFRVMAMELLGRSLEDRKESCGGRLSVQTAVLVAEQVLRRIEYLHSRGIIHRDIKPENFTFGIGPKAHHVYVIDFGLSRCYHDGRRHVPYSVHRGEACPVGTVRYASINNHRGVEQSRRDDLEAAGYMLVYLLRGSLPWSGLKIKPTAERDRRIRQIKEEVPLRELCGGFPDVFEFLLAHSRGLGFKARPDYSCLREALRDARERHGPEADHGFPWLEGRDLGALVPLESWSHPPQPDDSARGRATGLLACLCGRSQAAE